MAAWGSALPFDGWWITMPFMVEGDRQRPEGQRDPTRYQHVSASYFQTLGIPIIAGRPFSSSDTAGGLRVCVVDEAFVRRYLLGHSPLGTRILGRGMNTGRGVLPVREIVGLASQVKERPDESEPEPLIAMPLV